MYNVKSGKQNLIYIVKMKFNVHNHAKFEIIKTVYSVCLNATTIRWETNFIL